ncbi:hypothetical protein JR316_0001557 [Psilocybe cubensis]|uniref:Uncharacterized protein n=1 Tax=Psilocybe cubensis TaxID=181762 RepID=A0ACB8H9Q8_PSICU|nr:hypothetical protein JR316_0001557 [Psilocybe cubensis]KAH9484658.1 hypothetical protein JR316_0001557 [Psilocybe cubensis]
MSSQYSAAFSRAMSPSLDALTQAVVNNTVFGVNDEAGRQNALIDELATVVIKKIAECRSVDQIIDCVFFDYRAALREFLLNLASWCDKRETVRASLERLELAAINDGAIQAKKDELAFWEDKCALASCYEAAAVIVKTTYEDRKSSYKLPVFSTDNKGVRRIAEWVTSPQKKAECSALQTILPAIFSHIKQIVKLRHRALAIKIEKKRSTAATADVEMADATKPGPSIQSLIDKGLNARLKKLNLGYTSSGQSSSKAPQPQAKKTGPSKPKSSSTPSQRKPQTKASNKVDNKKKGKGRAPVKNNNPKGKGKARA